MSAEDRPIAQALKARMATVGMSQRTYADHLGMRQSHLSAVLHGKVECPGIEIRRRMAEDLNISHAELLVLLGVIAAQEFEPRSVAWIGGKQHPREHRWSEQQRRVLDRLKLLSENQAEQTAQYMDFLLSHQGPAPDTPRPSPPTPVEASAPNGRAHQDPR